MNGGVTLRFDDDYEEEDQVEAKQTFYNEYFYVGEDEFKSVCLYVLFKLKMIAGRSLIICENVN